MAIKFKYVKVMIFIMALQGVVYVGWLVYNQMEYNARETKLLQEILRINTNHESWSERKNDSSNTSMLRHYDFDQMEYIINGSHICGKAKGLLLTAVIISKPNNKRRRKSLRGSWAKPLSESNSTTAVFFMGLSKVGLTNKNVKLENNIHRDIVVVDFDESYHNLSLKTILMLRWIRDFCPNTRFILKCDDDMFINVYNLMTFVQGNLLDQRTIYGKVAHAWKPNRSKISKWVVSREVYNESFYPDFVFGPSYLVGIDAVSDLIEVCIRLPYMYLEDVFVTGICAREVNVSRVLNADFRNEEVHVAKCGFFSVISVHRVYGKRLKALHVKASNFTAYKNCSKREPKLF